MVLHRKLGVEGSVKAQLMESPEWSGLAEYEVQLVEQSVSIGRHEKGEVIFSEGDPCGGLYFLTSGLVCIRKARSKPNSTLVKIARPGDTLGYRPLLAAQNHRASAEALVASTSCFVEKSLVELLMRSNPTLGINFLKRAAVELGEAEERFHQSVSLSVKERFIRLLVALQAEYGHVEEDGKMIVELPVSRADLAAMLGVRRESLSRAIHELSDEGLVQLIGRHLELHEGQSDENLYRD